MIFHRRKLRRIAAVLVRDDISVEEHRAMSDEQIDKLLTDAGIDPEAAERRVLALIEEAIVG